MCLLGLIVLSRPAGKRNEDVKLTSKRIVQLTELLNMHPCSRFPTTCRSTAAAETSSHGTDAINQTGSHQFTHRSPPLNSSIDHRLRNTEVNQRPFYQTHVTPSVSGIAHQRLTFEHSFRTSSTVRPPSVSPPPPLPPGWPVDARGGSERPLPRYVRQRSAGRRRAAAGGRRG